MSAHFDTSESTWTPRAMSGPGRVYRTFFKKMLSKAATRLASLRLLGFHKDGLRIETAVRLYKLLVRPILEFGAAVIPFAASQIIELEKFQAKALRELLALMPNAKAETVRLLSGVEPIACRRDALLLNHFHRLRNSEKPVIVSLLKSQMQNVKLVRCFGEIESSERKNTSEWVSRCTRGYSGILHSTMSRLKILHEFTFDSNESRSKFHSYVRKTTRGFYFNRDCLTFASTEQGKLFKNVTLPLLKQSLPYAGLAVNKAIFQGTKRECRTAYLQALSGAHFASEIYCAAFKNSRSKLCPFCDSDSRTLHHFILECSHFATARTSLYSDLDGIWSSNHLPKTDFNNLHFLFGKPVLSDRETALRKAEHKCRPKTTKRFTEFLALLSKALNP